MARKSAKILSGLLSELPAMTFKCRVDPQWTIIYVSEGSKELTGYSARDLVNNNSVAYVDLIHPTDRPVVRETIEESLAQGESYEVVYRLQGANGEKQVWERGHAYSGEEHSKGLEGVIMDITTRKEFISQGKTTPQISALMGIARDVASTLELEPLLGKILDKLNTVLEYDAASIMKLEGDVLNVSAYRGPIQQQKALEMSFPLQQAGANREVIRRKEPIVVGDIHSDEPLASEFRSAAGAELENAFSYLRCWLGVPLIYQDEVLGMLTLDHTEPNHYSYPDAEMAMAFANQVSLAIENARLYEREKERLATSEQKRLIAEGFRETVSALNSNQSLDMVLDTVLDQTFRTLGAGGAAIYQLERLETQPDLLLASIVSKNMPEEFTNVDSITFDKSKIHDQILQKLPLSIENLNNYEFSDRRLTSELKYLHQVIRQHFSAALAIPLNVQEELFGLVGLFYEQTRQFTDEEINAAVSFVDQAALAIENAQLNSKVEEAAIIEERNRMARELHDSVTQSLYSVTLFAEAAMRMADQSNLERVQDHLGSVQEMSQQALKEMRLLIYQLRDTREKGNNFEDRIKNRLETVERRSGVEFDLQVKGNLDLPGPMVEELYLITQEALNNAQKHAEASQVEVELQAEGPELKLRISDDGCGLDIEQARNSGGMGLQNMAERAEKIGGRFSVESDPGQGTSVFVTLSSEYNVK